MQVNKLMVNNVTYNFDQNIENPSQSVFVFLHGFLGSRHDFDKLISAFPEQYLSLDLLGFGGNRFQNVPPKRFDQSAQIDDLESIFAELNLTKINLVGYSMGGRLAIAYALKYPKRINKLYLESTTAGIADKAGRAQRIQHDEQLAQKVNDDGMKKFVTDWEKLPLFTTQRAVSDSDFEFMHNQRLTQNPTNVANSLKYMGTGKQTNHWDEISSLSNLSVEIIVGSLDKKFIQIGKKMNQQINGSNLTIVENVGHNIHFEQPTTFQKIILSNE